MDKNKIKKVLFWLKGWVMDWEKTKAKVLTISTSLV